MPTDLPPLASDIAGQPLRFEHLVQINDASLPQITPLSRQQLWRGLVLRAQAPGFFMPWLDDSRVAEQPDGSLERHLRFGDYQVHDLVQFVYGESVRYDVLEDAGRFSLTMKIEEPLPQALFVRFVYEAHSEDHHADSPLGDLVKAAYRQADEDTVFRIRQLLEIGALDERCLN